MKGILKHHYGCLVAHSRKERSAGKSCTLRFEGEVLPSNGDIDSNIRSVVMDGVMVESIGGDGCYGCDGKSYSLFNLETQLELVEYYTTGMEKELEEQDNLEEKPSPESPEQGQRHDSEELQANGHTDKETAPSVTNTVPDDEDD